ncbi:MAG: hypothetical protein ACXACU_01050 [Candidatus Hodarchaeales archaeon]
MSEEEIRNLKMRIYELTNANNVLQQENSNLQTRVSELYSWTQQAQVAFQEKENLVQNLESQIHQLQQMEEQRKLNRGEMTIDQLYKQNQQLEVQNRELLENYNHYTDIIEEIYISSNLDPQIISKIENTLRKGKDPKTLLLIEMKKNPSASYSDLASVTGLREQQVKISADKLRRKGLIKEFGSGKGITFAKSQVLTVTDISNWKGIIDPKKLFNALIEYVKVSDSNIQISDALKEFRDILTSLIGTPGYMYEISKNITEFRMRMQDKNELTRRIIIWMEKWESSIKGVETYGTTIDDPSSWDPNFSSDELFSSMKRFIAKGNNTEISMALEKIRDILHEQHGHALFLVEIAREASKWKLSPQDKTELQNKLKDWNNKSSQR